MHVRTISPTDFVAQRRIHPDLELIDVRSPAEYASIHAEPARLVPLDSLEPATILQSRKLNGETPVYFICKSGERAAKACRKLSAAGFNHAISVEGGTEAWERAGLPVVRGKQTMSIERQVRIAAGSLVVVGMVLGWFVNQWFFALSAFVGAGLVFAGLTNTCGMGMALARMPWNQRA